MMIQTKPKIACVPVSLKYTSFETNIYCLWLGKEIYNADSHLIFISAICEYTDDGPN